MSMGTTVSRGVYSGNSAFVVVSMSSWVCQRRFIVTQVLFAEVLWKKNPTSLYAGRLSPGA